jgi:hypothetical protein
MREEEQLAICETCTNRKMDFNRGILCSITDEKPTFIDSCNQYIEDEEVKNLKNSENIILDNNKRYKISEKTIQKLKAEQNLPIGLLVSFSVGLIGAFLWAAITIATKFQIGYMAIAIGAAVGYTMRLVGKGTDQVFGISGAIIAILSCFLGNIFSLIGFVAQSEGLSYLDTLLLIDYSLIPSAMAENFSLIELFFYGIAGYEGYKFSFRVFTEKDLSELDK